MQCRTDGSDLCSTACLSLSTEHVVFRFFFVFCMLRVLVVFGLNATSICSLIIIINCSDNPLLAQFNSTLRTALSSAILNVDLNDDQTSLFAGEEWWFGDSRQLGFLLKLCRENAAFLPDRV